MQTGHSVNILLWNGEKELLVVSRKEDSTKFCLPGGKVDLNDFDDYYRARYYKFYDLPTPDLSVLRRAASRELKEETGVYVRPDDLQPVFTQKHIWRDTEYECTCFWAMCKMLPEVTAVEPDTWVGWRPWGQLTQEDKNPFYEYMIPLFKAIGVR